MDYSYLITPFVAWLTAGSLKFLVNSMRAGKLAYGLIGYGGLPSNHAAIVSSMTALIGLKEGLQHPAFGVAMTLTFIVLLDANSLRKQIGLQAKTINSLTQQNDISNRSPLRERIGHTKIELLAGLVVGLLVAYAVSSA
jgi:uncharacterized protein